MTQDNFVALCLAFCFVAFVGGCSYTLNGSDNKIMMRDCLAAQHQWVDGDCVKEVK